MSDSKNETIFTVTTPKPVAQAVADLNTAISNGKFSVLKDYDLKATFVSKGISFDNDCHVLEVCNAGHASKVLGVNMMLSTMLPCRITVYTDGKQDGLTHMSTMLPTKLLGAVQANDPQLQAVAVEVEAALMNFMRQAV